MGKLKDVSLGLDFESQPTHIIEFDPNAETESRSGRNGDYEVIPVVEAGQTVYLALSNKALVRTLQKITGKSRLEITRSGESYATTYTVKVLSNMK